ncbi:MAG: DUF6364 family protein [bacterium]
MKRKVGTTIEETLYRRAKEAAREQGRGLNEMIEEALERFLDSRAPRTSIVAETRGMFKASAKALKAVLEEDLYDAG